MPSAAPLALPDGEQSWGEGLVLEYAMEGREGIRGQRKRRESRGRESAVCIAAVAAAAACCHHHSDLLSSSTHQRRGQALESVSKLLDEIPRATSAPPHLQDARWAPVRKSNQIRGKHTLRARAPTFFFPRPFSLSLSRLLTPPIPQTDNREALRRARDRRGRP